MKRKAVFWAWMCAGALTCAAAGEKKTDTINFDRSEEMSAGAAQGGLPERAIPGELPGISFDIPVVSSNPSVDAKSVQGDVPNGNTGLKVLQGM